MRKPVWKVVKKRTRTSCTMRGKRKLKYEKGEIVKASEGTLGVFCFKTKEYAYKFIKRAWGFILLKVEPVGRGKRPIKISRLGYINLKNFYNNSRKTWTFEPPEGTICYPAVKVLE